MKYQVCGRRKKKGGSRSETNLRRFWKRPQIGGWWDGKILSFPAFNTPAINVANVPITKGLLFAEDWCSVNLFWHFIVFQVSTVTLKWFYWNCLLIPLTSFKVCSVDGKWQVTPQHELWLCFGRIMFENTGQNIFINGFIIYLFACCINTSWWMNLEIL